MARVARKRASSCNTIGILDVKSVCDKLHGGSTYQTSAWAVVACHRDAASRAGRRGGGGYLQRRVLLMSNQKGRLEALQLCSLRW